MRSLVKARQLRALRNDPDRKINRLAAQKSRVWKKIKFCINWKDYDGLPLMRRMELRRELERLKREYLQLERRIMEVADGSASQVARWVRVRKRFLDRQNPNVIDMTNLNEELAR